MKQIHYCNIGMAKSGTSAMFEHLIQHPQVDYRGCKENFNFSHFDWSLEQYKDYYKESNVSMNFCVAQWQMDSDQISTLNDVITHSSICLRNPWDYISSLYTFTKSHLVQSSEKFVDMLLETNQLDYAKIISHWTEYCKKPFLVIYYDDLLKNHSMVYDQITKFLGLENFIIDTHQLVNVTKATKQLITYTKDQASMINCLIDSSSKYLNVDLTHWKR